jgi:hypothetical protein
VLATPWTAVESTLAALPPWPGNTLVDATNAIKVYNPPTVELFDFGDRTSSEVVASLAPGASVIKAFNHIPFTLLRPGHRFAHPADRRPAKRAGSAPFRRGQLTIPPTTPIIARRRMQSPSSQWKINTPISNGRWFHPIPSP